MQATFRRIAFELKMSKKQFQVGDMVGVAVSFSPKKHKKAVLIFKILEIYLMGINRLDFHAAEKKIENFSKKGEHFQIFHICTVCMMQVLCEGGNISGTALHFF